MNILTPKKVVTALLLVGLFLISRPAHIVVGSEQLTLKESIGKVMVLNAIGDFKGYGRCSLTNLSWYWAPLNSLHYSEGRGVMISQYGIDALQRMNETEACKIAQAAADRASKKYRWKERVHLFCPLKVMEPHNKVRVGVS